MNISRTSFSFNKDTVFQNSPLRFEAGTPAAPEVVAFGVAIDYLQSMRKENIYRHELALLTHATKALEGIESLRIVGRAKEKIGIISFVHEKIHALDIETFLDFSGIALRTGTHCAQPLLEYLGISSTLRVSFGVYNTIEEIDTFIRCLKKVIQELS